MTEIKSISWNDLTGNKFSLTIHPAMDTEEGYYRQQLIRRIGESGKTVFTIRYDHDYLLRYIATKICRPLFACGKKRTLELVSEAWDLHYQSGNFLEVSSYSDN